MLGFIYNWLRKHHKVKWRISWIDKSGKIDDIFPRKAHPSDAGYDLFCAEESVEIPPHSLKIINLGFTCALPEGYELQIRPKSGLAVKNYITILNTPGTVDCNYRGPVQAIAMNHGGFSYTFRRGDKVCQGVICELPYVQEKVVPLLDDTDRGTGGFGSTGK